MRGTRDWSYDLCSEVERAVFDRLSVFPAGFDLPAARAVAAGEGVSDLDVVDVVPHLIDRSLLQRFTAFEGTTRYRMLETMRAYGREHLQHQGVADTTPARLAHYMAATIGALGLRTLGPDEHHGIRRSNEYLADAQGSKFSRCRQGRTSCWSNQYTCSSVYETRCLNSVSSFVACLCQAE